MEKQQIISFIKEQLSTGNISKGDLLSLVEVSVIQGSSSKEETSNHLIQIFYAIGAIIAIIGICILVAQNWLEIGFAGRILVTLGIAVLTYIAGLLFVKPEQNVLSQIMFIISTVLSPLGAYVLIEEASIDITWFTSFITSLILCVVFGTALIISKKNILTIVTVGFATWAYFTLLQKIFGLEYSGIDYIKWAIMLLGASYIFIAYGYRSGEISVDKNYEREKKIVKGILYGAGTLAILGSGITIGGFFDLIFIAFIFGAFYGSVYLKSRMMLLVAALFLIAHIINLTSQYFVDSIGWSVSLIAIGFIIIGVGYMTFYLNKKFISNK
jgi:MFS family permease